MGQIIPPAGGTGAVRPAVIGSGCRHCWHLAGHDPATNQMRRGMVCCHCGESAECVLIQSHPPREHGPHDPTRRAV